MSLTRMEAGTIVRLDGRRFRLLRKLPDDVWQVENPSTLEITQLKQEDLLAKLADGSLVFPALDAFPQRGPILVLDEQNQKIAQARLAYVLAVLDVPDRRADMDAAIKTVWDATHYPSEPPSRSTVYRWQSRYIEAQRDYRALANDSLAKGNHTYRFPDEVVSIARAAVQAKYLSRERANIQATYEEALRQTKRENLLRLPSSQLKLPSRKLVKRLIGEVPAFDAHVARYGYDAARRTFRTVNGHIVSDRPLHRAEIDHTVLDLFVLDDKTLLPLGRPYLTVCIDHFTRCILGICISFHEPGFQSVARCLKDCFRPKHWLKEAFPEIEHDWPAYGIMDTLVLDNAREFHSASLEQACLALRIVLSYAPRRVAWFKGPIERFLGTLNRAVAHATPGTCFSGIFERGDYDPEKHAVVTLATLELIIRKFIADVYHQQVHSALSMPPAKMWNLNIKPEEISHPDEGTNLDMILSRFQVRKLTHKGVENAGLFYNSPELASLRNQYGPTLDVEVRVNDANLGTAYVTYPPTRQTYSVPALGRDYAEGLTLYQHKVFRNWLRRNPDLGTGTDGWLRAKEDITRIIEASIKIKRHRFRKRLARFNERPGQVSVENTASAALTAPKQHPALPAATSDGGAAITRVPYFAPIIKGAKPRS